MFQYKHDHRINGYMVKLCRFFDLYGLHTRVSLSIATTCSLYTCSNRFRACLLIQSQA